MRRPDLATFVIRELTRQRQAHHLPVTAPDSRLVRAAHAHNVRMAAAGRLSHQLPGEATLGTRLRQVGYRLSWAGENLAETTRAGQAGAVQMQRLLYNERPPNDGHRRNILWAGARHVGVDVWEADGQLWLTQILARPL